MIPKRSNNKIAPLFLSVNTNDNMVYYIVFSYIRDIIQTIAITDI